MTDKPITRPAKGIRQRRRADGSWRVWWEPSRRMVEMGFTAQELDADRPTWSVREAERINRDVARAKAGGVRHTSSSSRSIEALASKYLQHTWFKKLAPATQKDYRNALATIREKWGDELAHHISKPVMAAWYETLCERNGEYQALRLLRIMSRLMNFAEIIGWRPENSNPCQKLGMTVPKGRSTTATWDDLEALIAAADARQWASIACAIPLATLNGMRVADVRDARIDGFSEHPHYGLVWQFVRSKRKNLGAAPVHPFTAPRVRALLEAATAGQEKLLIDEMTGTPYTQERFNARWRTVRDDAAKDRPHIAGLKFLDFRRSFGNLARASGAGKDDVGDMLGNSAAVNPQLGEVYMDAQLATTARAVLAIKKSG